MSPFPSSPTRRILNWNAVLAFAALEIGIFACAVFAVAHADKVSPDAINGTFQIFNPLRRLSLGQHVGHDFDTYLGLGPLYLMRVATWFVEGDFRFAILAAYFLHAAMFLVGAVFLARLCGLSRATAAIVGAAFTLLAAQDRPWWMPRTVAESWLEFVWSFFAPGNSSLGLRSAAPVLAAIAWVLAQRVARVGEPGTRRRTLAFVGVLCGTAALWSNDYGLPSAAAILVAAWIFFPRDARGGLVGFTGLVIAIAAVSALLLLVVITHGSPGAWFDYNFLCVARDQGWYFQVTALAEDRWMPFVLGGVTAGLLALKRRLGIARREDAPLFLVTFATLAAGALSNLGHYEERYFFPLYRTLVFVGPYVLVSYAAVWLPRLGPELVARLRRVGSALRVLAPAAALPLLAIGAILCVPVFVRCAELITTRAILLPSEVWVPELGGRGPLFLSKIAALGRSIRAEAEAAGVPRERRIFSTYATALDVFADAVQPTGNDYVIHALGSRRESYVRTFLETKPLYVTTLRTDRLEWEWWVQRMNWDFYAKLLERYEPFDETYYHVLWRPRTTPFAASPLTATARAQLSPELPGTALIQVNVDAADDGARNASMQLVEVELDYEIEWTSPLTVMRAIDLQEPGQFGPAGRFGAPPHETRWRFPAWIVPGKSATVAVTVRPERSGNIRRLAARARVVGPASLMSVPRLERLMAADYSWDIWQRGTWQATEDARFHVVDHADLRDLKAGDRLRFAGSGVRTVQQVENGVVYVDGARLNAATDGFPNWIEVVRE